ASILSAVAAIEFYTGGTLDLGLAGSGPLPQRGARLTVARLKQLLSKHRIRRWTAEQLHDVLVSPPLPLAAGSADAISEHALLLLPQLRLLYRQRQDIRDRIETLLDGMVAQGREGSEFQEHRDVGLAALPAGSRMSDRRQSIYGGIRSAGATG